MILIVDDEIEITKTIEKHLNLLNIPCCTANNAHEAYKLHCEKVFPVIISDIVMPEMSGVEFIKKCKAISPTTIFFIMTGFSTLENLMDCMEVGISDYFTKPFNDMEIITNSLHEAEIRSQRWKSDFIKIAQKKRAS